MKNNQLIVFVFFGAKYLKQFEVSLGTIPDSVDIALISDVEFSHPRVKLYPVFTPADVFECLSYRSRLHNIVNIHDYSRVWYADCDILFSGDVFAKYKDSEHILVSNEPFTRMDNEHMNGCFTPGELTQLIMSDAPAINGGLYSVPASQYAFFETYYSLLEIYNKTEEKKLSADQHVLNYCYHRKLGRYQLFDRGDVGFPPRVIGKYINHFIGMHLDGKDVSMRKFLENE